LLAAVLLSGPLLARDPEPRPRKLTDEEFARAEKLAKARLEKSLGLASYTIGHVKDKSTANAFPAHAFFAVLGPPDRVKVVNLYAVGRNGTVATISSTADLKKWFGANLPRRPSAAALETAARAWVRLGQELHQDGYYHFEIECRARVGKGKGWAVVARGKVTSGGDGAYEATLTFDREGKLLEVVERAKLRPGPRPLPPPDENP
jgi:hypothetical protein